MKWLAKAETLGNLMLILLSGAFVFGAWSATLEYRVQRHDLDIESHEARLEKMKDKYEANQEKLVDTLGRIDERLKNIERKR